MDAKRTLVPIPTYVPVFYTDHQNLAHIQHHKNAKHCVLRKVNSKITITVNIISCDSKAIFFCVKFSVSRSTNTNFVFGLFMFF
jgi:hypothetical protein